MKRLIPLLLALLLLLCACGTAPTPETPEVLPEEILPNTETDEYELPIVIEGDEPSPPAEAPVGEDVTLDGLNSYFRLTLPQGWVWERTEDAGTELIVLHPADDPDFAVEMRLWPGGFGMCGTGVTFSDYLLADGRKASLAYEIIGDDMSWTLILPPSPDAFTLQFWAPKTLYEAHRAQLEEMMGTIRIGELAGLNPVVTATPATE